MNFVQRSGNKRHIMLDGKYYRDNLIPVHDMATREQTLYRMHESQALRTSDPIKRSWYFRLRNNAARRRGWWI